MGRDRHRRAELLDGQVVVVVRERGALGGEVGAEERELVAERAVELDRRVLAPHRLDALLELRLAALPTRTARSARAAAAAAPRR